MQANKNKVFKGAQLVGLTAALAAGASVAQASPIIGEFRVRGPGGANDEYIRIVNPTNAAITVASTSGGGWGIAASDGVLRCTVPNGTVLPAGGSYLCVNSAAYSLGGVGAVDTSYTTDIADNAGLALFSTNVPADFSSATRLDAVGSTSETNTLYKEGTGYAALTPFSIEYAFVRDLCGKGGSISAFGACPSLGTFKDTGDNATDFVYVNNNGTSAGAGQRLGAPGPANLSSRVAVGTALSVAPINSCQTVDGASSFVRNTASDPGNNSTFGAVELRRRFTNTSATSLTSLGFRIADLTTFPAPAGVADLRPRSSADTVVVVDETGCGGTSGYRTLYGSTLSVPPSQSNGGGFNSVMTVPAVSASSPLEPGASIDVRFLLGVQQAGRLRLGVIGEGTPIGGGSFEYEGCTDDGYCPLKVVSIRRVGAATSSQANVEFTVTFSKPVTGLDVGDFELVTTGLSGASIQYGTGLGATFTVTVSVGTGTGTLGLNIVDDDTIVANGLKLGGEGTGNGNFTGEVYNIVAPPAPIPTLTEWAMLLLAGLLGGGAAWQIRRRQQSV